MNIKTYAKIFTYKNKIENFTSKILKYLIDGITISFLLFIFVDIINFLIQSEFLSNMSTYFVISFFMMMVSTCLLFIPISICSIIDSFLINRKINKIDVHLKLSKKQKQILSYLFIRKHTSSKLNLELEMLSKIIENKSNLFNELNSKQNSDFTQINKILTRFDRLVKMQKHNGIQSQFLINNKFLIEHVVDVIKNYAKNTNPSFSKNAKINILNSKIKVLMKKSTTIVKAVGFILLISFFVTYGLNFILTNYLNIIEHSMVNDIVNFLAFTILLFGVFLMPIYCVFHVVLHIITRYVQTADKINKHLDILDEEKHILNCLINKPIKSTRLTNELEKLFNYIDNQSSNTKCHQYNKLVKEDFPYINKIFRRLKKSSIEHVSHNEINDINIIQDDIDKMQTIKQSNISNPKLLLTMDNLDDELCYQINSHIMKNINKQKVK